MVRRALLFVSTVGILLTVRTYMDVTSMTSLPFMQESEVTKREVSDRAGVPLMRTYQNRWNLYERLPLHEVPELLRAAFVVSEDRRFYDHSGADWLARGHAAWTNFTSFRAARGASTVTEQVVRMVRPRARTPWTRWIEGFEAMSLERHATKDQILEFYLDQVPYAANRRGVAAAARYYFGRDLATLSRKELLALVVLVRNPSAFDPKRQAKRLEGAIAALLSRLSERGVTSAEVAAAIAEEPLDVASDALGIEMPHFVGHVTTLLENSETVGPGRVVTTIDASLQSVVQRLLDRQVARLADRKIRHGGALVADHRTGEVLAWVVAGNGTADESGAKIDTVLTPRQPGSTLKPFLYAMALENGWTAATVLRDEPVADAVGTGMHTFRNFSRAYYGPVTLREALGNSLNTPAVRAIAHVGVGPYLTRLRELGFDSLTEKPDHYGQGLALGDGEVTLFELVRAYAALANQGRRLELNVLTGRAASEAKVVYPETVTSVVSDILSDPYARSLEFGIGSVLNLPVQTAVKTGTSTDFRDAWAVGYNYGFVVGVWMGNLDQSAAVEVTGAIGPAIVLRSIFAELVRHEKALPLSLSPGLERHEVCRDGDRVHLADDVCAKFTEYFVKGTEPKDRVASVRELRVTQPSPHLRLAINPRAPLTAQAFEFRVEGLSADERVTWAVDGEDLATTVAPKYVWQLARGTHELVVRVAQTNRTERRLPAIPFVVK